MIQKILIFRRGSIGDAVVSLPALSAIRQKYPSAELRLLTNTPIMHNAAQIEALLGQSSLISNYYTLPPGGGGISTLLHTKKVIKHWQPDKLIYLSEPSRIISLTKEYLFFRACGINQIEGMPFANSLRIYLPQNDNLWESEGERLLRGIGLPKPTRLETVFTENDKEITHKVAHNFVQQGKFIAFCIGGKLSDKDWGDANWCEVIRAITSQHPKLGIMLIGSDQESDRALRLIEPWQGPVLNLCGKTTPRVSALAMQDAQFYLGHDSGPMHLATLVNTPCVAIFSARAKPGVWFPYGNNHHIFYPWKMVDNVPNRAGFRNAGQSILTIKANSVIETCLKLLS